MLGTNAANTMRAGSEVSVSDLATGGSKTSKPGVAISDINRLIDLKKMRSGAGLAIGRQAVMVRCG
jgi:hypothetical protein